MLYTEYFKLPYWQVFSNSIKNTSIYYDQVRMIAKLPYASTHIHPTSSWTISLAGVPANLRDCHRWRVPSGMREDQDWRKPSRLDHLRSFFILSPPSSLSLNMGICWPPLSSKKTSWRCHLIETKSASPINETEAKDIKNVKKEPALWHSR